MAGLKEIREILNLHQRLDARQISQLLALPEARVDALLLHLEHMGLATRVRLADSAECLSGSCRHCSERKACQPEQWTISPR